MSTSGRFQRGYVAALLAALAVLALAGLLLVLTLREAT